MNDNERRCTCLLGGYCAAHRISNLPEGVPMTSPTPPSKERITSWPATRFNLGDDEVWILIHKDFPYAHKRWEPELTFGQIQVVVNRALDEQARAASAAPAPSVGAEPTRIRADPEALVALALHGALPTAQAEQILRGAFPNAPRFAAAPSVPAVQGEASPLPKVHLHLPDGDAREVKVWFTEVKDDGIHLSIAVAASPPVLPPGWLDEAMILARACSQCDTEAVFASETEEYWPRARARDNAYDRLRAHLKLAEVRGTAEPYTGEPK